MPRGKTGNKRKLSHDSIKNIHDKVTDKSLEISSFGLPELLDIQWLVTSQLIIND